MNLEWLKQIFNIMFEPTSIRPIRFTLLIENIFSVYRNLSFRNQTRCFIVFLRIIFEVAISVSSIVIHYVYLLPKTSINDLVCYYTNVINSLFPVLFATLYSTKFIRLIYLIQSNDSYFSNDIVYFTNMSKQDRVITIGIGIYLPILFFTVFYGSYARASEIESATLNIIYSLNIRVCDCRNIFEYIALYSILYVISQQLECISRVLSKRGGNIDIDGEERLINNEHFGQIRDETQDFEELSTVFSNIAECCKLFNEIYGLQLVFMIGWAITYCILFLYTTAFVSIKGFHDVTQLLVSLWRLMVFFLLLLLLSQTAQKKQNNARDLRQRLGKILISCVGNDEEYKSTKDFLRLVSTRSIQTKTFGAIDVDMSLIPSVIMFITSNTVIALQFSNIV